MQELENQKDNTQNKILSIKAKIDKQLEKTNTTYQQWSMQNPYKQNILKYECERNERYVNLQNELPILTEKINTVKGEIRDRESFYEHLSEKKEYIEKEIKERKFEQ